MDKNTLTGKVITLAARDDIDYEVEEHLSSNFILNNYMLPSVRGYIYMFFREISELRLLRSHL